MSERAFDVVLWGATGFTGGLVARDLGREGSGVRWALGGRDRGRLEGLREELQGLPTPPGGVLVAGSDDLESLRSMAREARVVLSTVGPYSRLGEPLVQACVDEGTDYCDITGEPEFVQRVLSRYDEAAREKRVRVVNCCGFDSVPHDLGVLHVVRMLPREVPLEVRGYVKAKGAVSGGTWNSAIEAFGGSWKGGGGGRGPRSASRPVRKLRGGVRYDRGLGTWVCPLPTIDPWIVRRTAREHPDYGTEFSYGHNLCVGSLPGLVSLGVGVGAAMTLAQWGPTRRLLGRWRPSGAGPSAEERKSHWFEVRLVGQGGGERREVAVRGGDPGYDETAVMVSESARCLARGEDLPERWGVLTPALAFEDVLIRKLQARDIRFEQVVTSG